MLHRFNRLVLLACVCSTAFGALAADDQSKVLVSQVAVESTGLTESDTRSISQALEGQMLDTVAIRSNVISSLQNLGYFRASADEPTIHMNKDEAPSANLTIKVRQGARYRLATFQVVGARALSPSRLRDLFPIEADDFYGVAPVGAGLNSLLQLYTRKGYRDATGVPVLKVDDANHTIDITIDVQEGEHYLD